MSRNFFVLRMRQIVRYLAELGLLSSVFVFGAMAYLFFFISFAVAKGTSSAMFVFAVFAALTIALQIGRPDKAFLKENQVNTYPLWAAEYLVLLAPMVLIFLIYAEYKLALACLVLALVAPIIPGSISWNKTDTDEQPHSDWTNGVQSNYSFILFFYLIGLVFFQEAVVVLASAFSISVVLSSRVPSLPSDEVLMSGEVDIKPLILENIISKLKTLALLFSPLAILFMVTNYRYWYAMIFFFIATVFLHVFAILMTYCHYRPGFRRQKNPLLIALGAFMAYMPWVSIIVPMWSIYYYYRAVKNLSIKPE